MAASGEEQTKLLYVEDSEADILLFHHALISSDYSKDYFLVTQAGTLTEAKAILEKHVFHIVILDLYLPDSDEFGGIKELVTLYPETPIAVLTGRYDKELHYELMELGVVEVLDKSTFKKNELPRSLINTIRRHSISRQLALCKQQLQ